MESEKPTSPSCSGCVMAQGLKNEERRQLLGLMATGVIGYLPFLAAGAGETDATALLVDADAEENFKPLRPGDLKIGKPQLVFPFDAKTGTPKNESRLNKLVLIRLAEDQMEAQTRSRSVSGVLAYSGICTHQGCDVKTWIAKESVLACYCHASKFALLDGAKVVSGPAPRPLPAVPLSMDGEYLSIASLFPLSPGQ